MYFSVPQPGTATATAKSGLVMFPESESEPKADAREASGFSCACAGRREIQWMGNPLPLGIHRAYQRWFQSDKAMC